MRTSCCRSSHDEVVHLKRSLLRRCRGLTGSRISARCMAGSGPSRGPLLFMGGELADEHLNGLMTVDSTGPPPRTPKRAAVGRLLAVLGRVAGRERALWAGDGGGGAFRWIAGDDAARGVAAIVRVRPDRRRPTRRVLRGARSRGGARLPRQVSLLVAPGRSWSTPPSAGRAGDRAGHRGPARPLARLRPSGRCRPPHPVGAVARTHETHLTRPALLHRSRVLATVARPMGPPQHPVRLVPEAAGRAQPP